MWSIKTSYIIDFKLSTISSIKNATHNRKYQALGIKVDFNINDKYINKKRRLVSTCFSKKKNKNDKNKNEYVLAKHFFVY